MLQSFFILCSGADRQLLEKCSDSEKTKYTGIGATVFFTAIMAFVASSYALYTVFENEITAILFGIIWGLLIFNLDRFIVSTLRKRDSFRVEFAQALPRLFLAIIIALVISKPLEIKIFEKEINAVLLQKKNELLLKNKSEVSSYFKKDSDILSAKIDSLKSEITTKEKEVNHLYQVYIEEAEGTSGTKKLGKGPVFKEKIVKHNLAKSELDSLRILNNDKIILAEKQLDYIQQSQSNRISEDQPIIDNFDGLMARIEALNQLPWLPSFFIMLLFLAIETAPIFTKLITPKGEYDIRLEHQNNLLNDALDQECDQSNLQKATNKTLNAKVYEDLISDKNLYEERKKSAKDLISFDHDRYVQKKKSNQW